MVRKGGFEPPRLSAPPPQDGVSASSTTSALCKLPVINILANSSGEGIYSRILHRLRARDALFRFASPRAAKNSLWTAASRGCTLRILVLMLSCPATYCNVKGSVYSRRVELDPRRHPHLDHAYAMTSHSGQGQTADRNCLARG